MPFRICGAGPGPAPTPTPVRPAACATAASGGAANTSYGRTRPASSFAAAQQTYPETFPAPAPPAGPHARPDACARAHPRACAHAGAGAAAVGGPPASDRTQGRGAHPGWHEPHPGPGRRPGALVDRRRRGRGERRRAGRPLACKPLALLRRGPAGAERATAEPRGPGSPGRSPLPPCSLWQPSLYVHMRTVPAPTRAHHACCISNDLHISPQKVLDTGGTDLADLNVKNGVSFVGGQLGSQWQDKQQHGTHVRARGPGGRAGLGAPPWRAGRVLLHAATACLARPPRSLWAPHCIACKMISAGQAASHSPSTRCTCVRPCTQVAGTISGQNQGFGVYGVLPGVRVLPVKVLSDDGYGSMSDIMAGINYVRGVCSQRMGCQSCRVVSYSAYSQTHLLARPELLCQAHACAATSQRRTTLAPTNARPPPGDDKRAVAGRECDQPVTRRHWHRERPHLRVHPGGGQQRPHRCRRGGWVAKGGGGVVELYWPTAEGQGLGCR